MGGLCGKGNERMGGEGSGAAAGGFDSMRGAHSPSTTCEAGVSPAWTRAVR